MKIYNNFLVLLLLLTLIFSPPLLSGYKYLITANQTSDPLSSSKYFEKAYRFLFWNSDIIEKAGLLSNNDVSRQISLLTLAKINQPLQNNSKIALGNAYYLTGKTDLAVTIFEEVAVSDDINPKLISSQKLSDIYHKNNQFAKEYLLLQNWLMLEPENSFVLKRIGLILAARGDEAGAQYLRHSQNIKFDSQLEQLITALTPNNNVQEYTLIRCGQALAQLGEWALAEMAFNRATKINNEYGEAWALLGYSKFKNMKLDPGFLFSKAENLSPDSVLIQSLIGSYWMELHNYKKAESNFLKTINIEPVNPNMWIAYANAVSYRDIPKALDVYLYAVKLDPTSEFSWFSLASFCDNNNIYLDEYGLKAALTAFSINPKNPENSDILGLIEMSKGQYATSEAMFQKALILAEPGQDAKYHFHLGILFFRLGRKDKALEELQAAASINPEGSFSQESKKFISRYFP